MKINSFSILETVFGMIIIAIILKLIGFLFSFFVFQFEQIKKQANWNFENEKLHFFITQLNNTNDLFLHKDSTWTWVNTYNRDTTKIIFKDSTILLNKSNNPDTLFITTSNKYIDTIRNTHRKAYLRLHLSSINKDIDTINMKFYFPIYAYQDIKQQIKVLKNDN